MRLRPKLVVLFTAALAGMLGLALAGFPRLVAQVSETQLFSLAKTLGAYLVEDLRNLRFEGDEAAFERSIEARFEFVQRLGEQTGNFRVNKIILIDQWFKVEVGHPESEIGLDYSTHADIVDAFKKKGFATVIEKNVGPSGALETDADIVGLIALADGDERVLEVKLDFSATLALLGAQYARVQAIALIVVMALLVALVGILLLGVRGAIIAPVLAISRAMEKVGTGDLDARAELRSRDELGEMALHFNQMVKGLKERFELERYVSKSTAGAARARAADGVSRPVERKRRTVFFSDVRGFTAYSERTDPARVVAVLNHLLGMQEEIIARCGGEVDKFVGDEAMAVFERPLDAVAASYAIRETVARMSVEIDGLSLGMGIHEGELVEGDIGSPRMMDHTVIGDTVNIGARLQAAAKKAEILVSATVAADRGVQAAFELVALGGVSVKGKEKPIEVWKVEGRKAK